MFGELEFWLSLLKVVAILALIAGGAAVLLSGMRIGDADATAPALANLWQHGGFFPNGIEGMIASFTVVMFAFGGVEVIGMAAGEAGDPRRVIPKAINSVPLRILLFYVLTLLVLMAIFLEQDRHARQPFVQIFSSLGIKAAADVLNLVVISAVISAVNNDIFSTGRMLYGMALNGQAPAGFARVSRFGVPWMTVAVMGAGLLVGVALNYLLPDGLFMKLAAIVTFSVVWVWLMILLSQLAMRRRLGPAAAELAFPVPLWPWGQRCAVVFMLFVFAVLAAFEDTRGALYVGLGWLALLSAAYLWLSAMRRHAGGASRPDYDDDKEE